MKVRWIFIVILTIGIFITGCQGTENQGTDNYGDGYAHNGKGLKALYKKEGSNQPDEDNGLRSIFPNAYDRRTGMDKDHRLGKSPEPGTDLARNMIPYGYVESSADDPFVIQQGYGADINIDREVLADAVSQIVVGLHNITDSAVIVTDRDVIIGYRANQNEAEDYQQQVELAGQSITPRWFNVYATDDMELVQSLKEVTKKPSNDPLEKQLRKQVDFIIQQLGGPKERMDLQPNQNDNRSKKEAPVNHK